MWFAGWTVEVAVSEGQRRCPLVPRGPPPLLAPPWRASVSRRRAAVYRWYRRPYPKHSRPLLTRVSTCCKLSQFFFNYYYGITAPCWIYPLKSPLVFNLLLHFNDDFPWFTWYCKNWNLTRHHQAANLHITNSSNSQSDKISTVKNNPFTVCRCAITFSSNMTSVLAWLASDSVITWFCHS